MFSDTRSTSTFSLFGGVNREHALDALAVADAADGEELVDAMTLAGDDDAGVNLDPLLVASRTLVCTRTVADFKRRQYLCSPAKR